MDIKSAERQIQGILKYLEDLDNAESRLYTKSKDRLKCVSECCEQILQVTSSLLKNEVLKADDSADTYPVTCMIDSMQSQLNEVGTLADITQFELTDNIQKELLTAYIKTFSKIANGQFGQRCTQVHELSKLLYDWITYRFIKYTNGFHYKFERISVWILNIIIAYCEALVDGTSDKFVRHFYTWLDALNSSTTLCKYAIPANIYKIGADGYQNHLTLSAVVMYDVLYECGFLKLYKSVGQKYPDYKTILLRDGSMYELVEKYKSEILDEYKSYLYYPQILKSCNIILRCPND